MLTSAARVARDHSGQHRVGHPQRRHERDVEIALPACGIRIGEKTGTDIAADIVDENGDGAEFLRGLQDARGGLGIEQVRSNKGSLCGAAGQSLSDDALAGVLIASHGDQLHALGGKIQRDGAPDIGRRTRYDHDLSGKFQVHVGVTSSNGDRPGAGSFSINRECMPPGARDTNAFMRDSLTCTLAGMRIFMSGRTEWRKRAAK